MRSSTQSPITNIEIDGNTVHHCPGSGIRADRVDNVTISNNVVYGNIWWTTSASSAIVFAETLGDGTCEIRGNVVYGNQQAVNRGSMKGYERR